MVRGRHRGACRMDAVRWLTYEEMGTALGITRESARQLVKRKHWPRQPGNDGLARIGVPEEVFASRPSPAERPADQPADDPVVVSADRPVEAAALEILKRHV